MLIAYKIALPNTFIDFITHVVFVDPPQALRYNRGRDLRTSMNPQVNEEGVMWRRRRQASELSDRGRGGRIDMKPTQSPGAREPWADEMIGGR